MKKENEFYTKEVSGDRGHGGCRWKVYERRGETMVRKRELNKYGEKIENKNTAKVHTFSFNDLHRTNF